MHVERGSTKKTADHLLQSLLSLQSLRNPIQKTVQHCRLIPSLHQPNHLLLYLQQPNPQPNQLDPQSKQPDPQPVLNFRQKDANLIK